jgi:ureidoglycolate dehydrogenase (NAD+)
MQVSLEEIKSLLTAAAAKFVTQPEAAYYAELTLETHLKKSPRMNPVAEALPELEAWRDNPGKQMTTVHEKAGVALYDFAGLAPALKIKPIHDGLEARAREHGLAAAGFHNSAGVWTLNMWADGLARRDLIGMAMFNGGAGSAVPFGGKRGVLGTNPFNYAIPTADKPIVLDMATTEIPFVELKDAKDNGQPLRPGVALDLEGRPTTDADQALTEMGANLLPMGGGFKGYGIMMLVEVLTGPLVRSLLSTRQTRTWTPPEYGGFVLAIDIGSFTDPVVFKTAVAEMCVDLRAEAPAPGFSGVSVPGDRGHAKVAAALERGCIDIEDKVLDSLRDLAK